jgi:hypothetical protein
VGAPEGSMKNASKNLSFYQVKTDYDVVVPNVVSITEYQNLKLSLFCVIK